MSTPSTKELMKRFEVFMNQQTQIFEAFMNQQTQIFKAFMNQEAQITNELKAEVEALHAKLMEERFSKRNRNKADSLQDTVDQELQPSVVEVGVTGTPKTLANNSKESLTTEENKSPDSTCSDDDDDQYVIIPTDPIRVFETDCVPWNFDTFTIDDSQIASSSVSSSSGTQFESVDGRALSSGSVSPVSKQQSTDESLESYSNYSPYSYPPSDPHQQQSPYSNYSPYSYPPYPHQQQSPYSNYSPYSYPPSDPHQQQSPSEFPNFWAYDNTETGYDHVSYSRTGIREYLEFLEEGFSSNVGNNTIPATRIPMVQQQEAQAAQMFPQNYLPSYVDYYMPYHQSTAPYVPPMVMPGYSNSPTYWGQTAYDAYLSHMQFPGMYYPQQPGAIPNPHNMGRMRHNMGDNVAGRAPGTHRNPQFNF